MHPTRLGSALTHPYLTTDYSEALLEFVTPAYPTNWETFQFLCDSHCFVCQNLEGELLWAQSMPCIVNPSQDLPVASYGTSNIGQMKTIYRRGLGYRYGRAMQAIAGVHYNYSLPISFWEPFREQQKKTEILESFISAQYMGLVRNYRRLAWLFIYLFGASPALCKSFCPEGHEILEELDPSTWHGPFSTSLRMSDIGYRNKTQAELQISANSLTEYTAGLAAAVTTPNADYEKIGVRVNGEYRQLSVNILQIENEYYSSIRPKPAIGGDAPLTVDLRGAGVEYVEVRTLDINMLDPVGVNQNQLRFAEAALIYCLLAESPPIDAVEQAEIDARDLAVALEGRKPGLMLLENGHDVSLQARGIVLVDRIQEVAAILDADGEGYLAAVEAQRAALMEPRLTPSAQILEGIRDSDQSFLEFTLDLSKAHAEYFCQLRLSPEKTALFTTAAERSLERTQALEQLSGPTFEAYLASYFERL
ncbi:MAG: glutamate--cysteine ligase, partial [Gammaproteobacteria bacterium]|nr:glutamate--cysteine ligase [Gammaproteobacteria bacterium]